MPNPSELLTSDLLIIYSVGRNSLSKISTYKPKTYPTIGKWLKSLELALKPTKKFSTKNNAYGTISIRLDSADYLKYFFYLSAELFERFLWEDKLQEEAVQYNCFYAALAAKSARNEYFFPGKSQRKLVVSSPDECISLLQLSYDKDFMAVNAHIRSSDLVLFPLDLLFILSLPFALKAKSKDFSRTLQFNISFSNLHRGNRSPGKKKHHAYYTPLDFVLEVKKFSKSFIK